MVIVIIYYLVDSTLFYTPSIFKEKKTLTIILLSLILYVYFYGLYFAHFYQCLQKILLKNDFLPLSDYGKKMNYYITVNRKPNIFYMFNIITFDLLK